MSDRADNLQVNQPNIITPPSTNWPDPLVDPSSQLKVKVTHGSSGEQRNFQAMSTSQQDNREHALAEGDVGRGGDGAASQGGNANKWETSQQNAGEHATIEGD